MDSIFKLIRIFNKINDSKFEILPIKKPNTEVFGFILIFKF